MSKNLYCPKCHNEYWGNSKNAQCSKCHHTFNQKEISLCTGYEYGDGKIEFTNPTFMKESYESPRQ